MKRKLEKVKDDLHITLKVAKDSCSKNTKGDFEVSLFATLGRPFLGN